MQEAQRLTVKLGHLAEGATWVFHLLTNLYASIAQVLAGNKQLLMESLHDFRDIVKSLHTDSFTWLAKYQAWLISFAFKLSARIAHHSKHNYIISKNMRREIEFFREKLLPSSGIRWEMPITHII